MRRLSLLAATAALLLAGCSSDSDSEPADAGGTAPSVGTSTQPSAQPSADVPGAPECDEIWVAGQILPAGYDTCLLDGQIGPQDVVPCADGTKLITFNDALYAVTGKEIVEPEDAPLQDTDEYGAVYRACTDAEE